MEIRKCREYFQGVYLVVFLLLDPPHHDQQHHDVDQDGHVVTTGVIFHCIEH